MEKAAVTSDSQSSRATSLVDAIQLDFGALLASFGRGDLEAVNATWHRLQLHAQIGKYAEIDALAARFWDATGANDGSDVRRALTELGAAVARMPRPALNEAAARGAVSAAQIAYVEFLMAQSVRDPAAVADWLDRLHDAAFLGDLTGLRVSVDAFKRALESRNQPAIQAAADDVYQAVMSLP